MNPRFFVLWGLTLAVCLGGYAGPTTPPDTAPKTEAAATVSIPLPLVPNPNPIVLGKGASISLTEVQELELITRLQTTIAVMYRKEIADAEETQRRTGKLPEHAYWHKLIGRIAAHVLHDIPLTKQNHYKLYLGWLTHLSLSHVTKTIYEIARTQGIPAATAVTFGMVMDLAVAPAFFTLIGHPFWAVYSWIVPWEVPGFALGHAVQSRLIRHRLTRLYGGKEAYAKFRQPFYDNLEQLHLDGIEDLLIPLVSKVEEANGVVISDESGFFEHWATRFGWSTHRMNATNLFKFCRKRKIATNVVDALENATTVPAQIKAVLLLHYLDEQGNADVLNELAVTFSRSFVEIENRPDLAPLTPWIRRFAHAHSRYEVEMLMRDVPRGTQASLVAQLWESAILPMVLQNNPTISFGKAQRLRSTFGAFLAAATSEPAALWDETWYQRFTAYTDAVFPKVNGLTSDWPPKPPPAPPRPGLCRRLLGWLHLRTAAT